MPITETVNCGGSTIQSGRYWLMFQELTGNIIRVASHPDNEGRMPQKAVMLITMTTWKLPEQESSQQYHSLNVFLLQDVTSPSAELVFTQHPCW